MRKKEVMKETGKNEEGNDRECTINNLKETECLSDFDKGYMLSIKINQKIDHC